MSNDNDDPYPSLPDRISVDRLPDDTPVLRTPSGFGDENNVHLFRDCKHVDEDRVEPATFAHALADRDDVCLRCSGNANEGSGSSPHKDRRRLEEQLEPRHVDGLTPMPEARQTPELDDDHDTDADPGVVAGD